MENINKAVIWTPKTQVLYIRNSGKSTKELMKELGFSKPFINNIKAKRAYSWI